MQEEVIVGSAITAGLAIALYWIFMAGNPATHPKKYPSVSLLVLIGLALALTVWSTYVGRPTYSYSLNDNPVVIAIAFDLSPSMLAIPDPGVEQDARPRFERGISVLQELLRQLEDSQQDVLVSIIGFTRKAEVIMGWESNPTQVREILEFVVSPDLFTSSGTSIEAAVKGLVGVFNTLPQNLQEKSQKFGILVSDGEDTQPYSYLEYVVEELEAGPFDIISLQTGMLGMEEGVPEYGEFGEFLHFQQMGGKLYTVPDVDTMTQISAITSHRGLYVRAESPGSVGRMLEFIGNSPTATGGIDKTTGVVVGLFIIVVVLYTRLIL